MLRHALIGLVATLFLAGGLLAQAPPQPGPEHAKLQELVGEWDAVMEMGGQKTKATASYRSVGGFWVASEYRGEVAGMKFQGHGLDGYDQTKKKHVGVWVDSMSSAPMHFSGDIDPATKLLVMTGEHPGPDGKPQKFKTTTAMKDKDHFTFKMFMVGPDGKDQLAFTIEYTRKK